MVAIEKADGTRIESPTAEDVAAALAGPRGEDWYLTVERGEDDLMDVVAEGEALRLRCDLGEAPTIESATAVDDSAAREIIASFAEGSEAWRHLVAWGEPVKATARPKQSPEMKRALSTFAGVFMGGLLLASFLELGPWIAVWFALGIPGMVAAAMAGKQLEARRASGWARASGRVIRSRLKRSTKDGTSSVAADIEYEFSVGFNRYRGNRANLAEIVTGDEAKALVKRYPEGATVPVYYDPGSPAESVIDRELPAIFGAAWAFIAVLVALVLMGAWWFLVRK